MSYTKKVMDISGGKTSNNATPATHPALNIRRKRLKT